MVVAPFFLVSLIFLAIQICLAVVPAIVLWVIGKRKPYWRVRLPLLTTVAPVIATQIGVAVLSFAFPLMRVSPVVEVICYMALFFVITGVFAFWSLPYEAHLSFKTDLYRLSVISALLTLYWLTLYGVMQWLLQQIR